MARPSEHQMVEAAISELNGRGAGFEVIQLRRLEPQMAVLTINKYFKGSDATSAQGPTVDGDPETKRLWVKGTQEQLKVVRTLIEQLEATGGNGSVLGDRMRVLPLTGSGADNILQQLEEYWPLTGRANQLRIVSPANRSSGLPERRTPAPTTNPAATTPPTRPTPGVGSPASPFAGAAQNATVPTAPATNAAAPNQGQPLMRVIPLPSNSRIPSGAIPAGPPAPAQTQPVPQAQPAPRQGDSTRFETPPTGAAVRLVAQQGDAANPPLRCKLMHLSRLKGNSWLKHLNPLHLNPLHLRPLHLNSPRLKPLRQYNLRPSSPQSNNPLHQINRLQPAVSKVVRSMPSPLRPPPKV